MPAPSGHPASIGPYAVDRELGRGGMGVVYLARDARLGRSVAIKALPAELALDPGRLARFQREARVVASLSHAHIATVFGLEELATAAGAHTYIVMEYVEGPTLADRLAAGPLPVDEAITLAAQVAAGVEAAHEAGVIHRDLKPANIKLTADGRAKVLDFGLARELPPAGSRSGHDPLATFSRAPMTDAGAIMGTVGYMAPEQARGRTVDRRADIFAFACVLYEMLTGKPPFAGPSQADVLAALLEREPDLSKLPARTPTTVRELLARGLEKDPNRRLRDIGDARIILQEAVDKRSWSGTGTNLPPPPRARTWPRLAGTAALIAASLALGAVATWWLGSRLGAASPPALPPAPGTQPSGSPLAGAGTANAQPAPASTTRLSMVFPEALAPVAALQLAPDGRTVAYIAEVTDKPGTPPISTVCVRALDRYEPRRLSGTDYAINLAYAADGQSLLVVTRQADDQGERAVWSVPIDGASPPVRLMVRPPLASGQSANIQLTGLPGGDVLVTDQASREFIRLRAGRDVPITRVPIQTPERTDEVWPRELLPDGHTLICTSSGYANGVYAITIDLYDLDSGKLIKRLTAGLGQQYHKGLVYFLRDLTLMASRFDLERLELTGDPVPVESPVPPVPPIPFRVSVDGKLGFWAAVNRPDRRSLAIVDTAGRITPLDPTRRNYPNANAPMVSRDGKRYALTVERTDRLFEVWTGSIDQPTTRRLSSVPGADVFLGAISPNGDRCIVSVFAGEQFDLRVIRSDNTAEPLTLFRTNAEVAWRVAGWSANPDKVFFSFGTDRSTGFTRTVLADVRAPIPDFDNLPSILPGGAVSAEVATAPDGRWIAYSPVANSLSEAYLLRWENDKPAGEPARIPVGPLESSVMFAEGNVLHAPLRNGTIARVAFKADEAGRVTFTPAETVMDRSAREVVNAASFSPLPDGRFLAILNEERGPIRPVFQIIHNFAAEVEAKLSKSAPRTAP